MTAYERRAEIMRILATRRQETMPRLAAELNVTVRTIWSDIIVLTVDYPISTTRGIGGCVKLDGSYHPRKFIFSMEQQNVLMELLNKADDAQQNVLREMLTEYGSHSIRNELTKCKSQTKANSQISNPN